MAVTMISWFDSIQIQKVFIWYSLGVVGYICPLI